MSSGNAPPRPPDLRISLDDVLSAEKRRSEEVSRVDRFVVEQAKIRGRVNVLERQLRWAHRTRSWVLPVRQFLENSTTVVGGYIIVLIVVFGQSLVLGHFFRLSWPISLLVTGLLTLIVAAIGSNLFRFDEAANAILIETLNRQASEQREHLARAGLELERAKRAFETARDLHERIRAAFEAPINQLRQTPWRTLKGEDFEGFLASIFRAYGVPVETTKRSGDQGVDLVLTIKGRRIAIQAKGYPGTTVGNKAVQEAHTGMAYYSCTASAVITNSSFTSGAIEIARSVNCLLIDGNSIPDLIEGRFPF